MLATLLGAKVGTALAAGTLTFGGVAAAAYSGTLPAGLQDLAHATIRAPAAGHDAPSTHTKPGTPTTPPAGPDAAGPAAFGLCTAWEHARVHGNAADKSIAFRNLATAAGGTNRIAKYCATVLPPAATHRPPAQHPTGKPSGHPTGSPSAAHHAGVGTSHRP